MLFCIFKAGLDVQNWPRLAKHAFVRFSSLLLVAVPFSDVGIIISLSVLSYISNCFGMAD